MQFGSYTFLTGWSCKTDDDQQTVPVAPIPRAQGGAWLPGQRKPRSFTLSGGFTTANGLPNVTSGTVRTAIDTMKAALLAGPSNFQLDTDRFFRNVQLESAPTNWESYYNLWGELDLKLIAPDPYQYSTTQTTTGELSSPLSYSVSAGNAFTLPAWYIRANVGSGTAFNWTWTNTTTGEVMNLAGNWPISGAGYLIVDALAHTVQSAPSLGGTAGPADANLAAAANAFSLFEKQMPSLVPGANAFTLSQTGAVVSGVWAVFRGRWL